MGESEKKGCDKKEDAEDSEKEESVAEVGDTDRRLGGWGALGVREEEGLVFGADGRAEDGHGDRGFF
jgi:hypothetical protein